MMSNDEFTLGIHRHCLKVPIDEWVSECALIRRWWTRDPQTNRDSAIEQRDTHMHKQTDCTVTRHRLRPLCTACHLISWCDWSSLTNRRSIRLPGGGSANWRTSSCRWLAASCLQIAAVLCECRKRERQSKVDEKVLFNSISQERNRRAMTVPIWLPPLRCTASTFVFQCLEAFRMLGNTI